MNLKTILKAQVVVVALAALAIGLFLGIYALMGDGTPAVTRLFSALFVPPLIIGVAVGGYFLATRR